MKFQTKVYIYKRNIISMLLIPVAFVKNIVETIYNWLMAIMFSELIHGRKDYNNLTAIIALACFIVVAILFYIFKYLDSIFFFGFVILWVIDQLAAKLHFSFLGKPDDISVASNDLENLSWTIMGGDVGRNENFTREDILSMIIRSVVVSAGAFEKNKSYTWELRFKLRDEQELVVFQSASFEQVWVLGNAWANVFNVQIDVDSSEKIHYFSSYDRDSENKRIIKDKIVIENQNGTTIIRSKKSWTGVKKHAERLFKESGILLFVLLASVVLEKSGHFFTILFGAFLGIHAREPLVIDLSLNGFFNMISPERKDLFQLFIAVFCMFLGGLNIYRDRIIEISSEFIKYFENGDKIASKAP